MAVNTAIAVDGILLLDKATGISSNRALQTCKRLLNARKAGHTGSLDPLATGLLPLCLGQATRLSALFLNADKGYRVTIRLGISTDSGDRDGNIISTQAVRVSGTELEQALADFHGEIMQVPPMYSALKKDGTPLYKLARQGLEVSRPPRPVRVEELRLCRFDTDLVELDIRCSKGFYVRSLAIDLGQKLGVGAMVEALRRTAVGRLSVAQSITMEQLAALQPAAREQHVLPLDTILDDMPAIRLTEADAHLIRHGQPVAATAPADADLLRLYSAAGQFIGLGQRRADGIIVPKKVFV